MYLLFVVCLIVLVALASRFWYMYQSKKGASVILKGMTFNSMMRNLRFSFVDKAVHNFANDEHVRMRASDNDYEIDFKLFKRNKDIPMFDYDYPTLLEFLCVLHATEFKKSLAFPENSTACFFFLAKEIGEHIKQRTLVLHMFDELEKMKNVYYVGVRRHVEI